LSRSVRLLTDVLSLTKPKAFSRTLRVRKIVRQIVLNMRLQDAWLYDLAGMLSLIGCVVLPEEILDKISQGAQLTKQEQSIYQSYPIIGFRLLSDIPRLEPVAYMIRDQQKSYATDISHATTSETRKYELGAQILKVALEYDRMTGNEVTHKAAVEFLAAHTVEYNPEVVAALGADEIINENWNAMLTDVQSANLGMILAEDIYTKDGELLVRKSQQITRLVLEQLQLVSEKAGIVEPFRVLVPA
jgi:response regulator RpfG family c-di-GMP phosphodiesterase